MEARLQVDGRELLRQLLQDHLDLRARRETRPAAVIGAGGVARGGAETGRERKLTTVFGQARRSGSPTVRAGMLTCTRRHARLRDRRHCSPARMWRSSGRPTTVQAAESSGSTYQLGALRLLWVVKRL
jgi:hypothetical protein